MLNSIKIILPRFVSESKLPCCSSVSFCFAVVHAVTRSNNHSVGLRILDLETGIEKILSSHGYREMLIEHPYTRFGFLTMQRKGSKLLLHHRNEEGQLIEETELPLLTTGYCSSNWRDISPDGSEIVYFNKESHNLIIRSLRTGEEKLLVPDITSSSVAIKLLKWLGAKEICRDLAFSDTSGSVYIYHPKIQLNIYINYQMVAGLLRERLTFVGYQRE